MKSLCKISMTYQFPPSQQINLRIAALYPQFAIKAMQQTLHLSNKSGRDIVKIPWPITANCLRGRTLFKNVHLLRDALPLTLPYIPQPDDKIALSSAVKWHTIRNYQRFRSNSHHSIGAAGQCKASECLSVFSLSFFHAKMSSSN